MNTVVWAVVCSAITGVVVYALSKSRAEVRLAQQREELAAVRATLTEKQQALEESLDEIGWKPEQARATAPQSVNEDQREWE